MRLHGVTVRRALLAAVIATAGLPFAASGSVVSAACPAGVMVATVSPDEGMQIFSHGGNLAVQRYSMATDPGPAWRPVGPPNEFGAECSMRDVNTLIVRSAPSAASTTGLPIPRNTEKPCSRWEQAVHIDLNVFTSPGSRLQVELDLDQNAPRVVLYATSLPYLSAMQFGRPVYIGTDDQGRTAVEANGDQAWDLIATGLKSLRVEGTSGYDQIAGSGSFNGGVPFAAASIPLIICGESGRDFISGGALGDWMDGGCDHDNIYSADNRFDYIDGGKGVCSETRDFDQAVTDRIDKVVSVERRVNLSTR